MRKTETLIIGGGITGLSVASFLHNKDYLIIEREDTCGGYCKTTIRNGFVWDYSGHFFHFRNQEIKDYVMENMACEVLEVKKITDIDYRGNIVDFPFQYNVDQLPKSDFIECMLDLYNAKEIDSTNFKEYVKSSMGSAIADRFLIPYNEKLYATDLNQLDADAMGRFFPKPMSFDQMMERLANKQDYVSYNDHFIYPVGGSIEFVNSLLKRVDADRIMTNTSIVKLDLKKKLAYTETEVIQFENLVSTLPFNVLMKLTGGETDNLTSNKVAVFNLGFNKPTDVKTHWRYYPGNEVFYRVGFYNNILGSDRMSLYVEIGAKTDQVLDENKLLMQVLADLEDVGVIEDGVHELVDHQFIVMNPAYVHITKESEAQYNSWSKENNERGIYSIGRYGSWTYCSIEDNIIQAKDCTERVRNKTLV